LRAIDAYWISDGVAKLLMVIVIIANIVIIPYTALLFLAVRRKLGESEKG
jgi:hypothetical protein